MDKSSVLLEETEVRLDYGNQTTAAAPTHSGSTSVKSGPSGTGSVMAIVYQSANITSVCFGIPYRNRARAKLFNSDDSSIPLPRRHAVSPLAPPHKKFANYLTMV